MDPAFLQMLMQKMPIQEYVQQAAPNPERDYLAKTIYGEARGEPKAGQQAVGDVIVNRAIQKGSSIKDTVLTPKQFSAWADVNAPKMATASAEIDPHYRDALRIAIQVLKGSPDSTGGATHYHAMAMTSPPDWASKLQELKTIGEHKFFK